MTHGPGGAARGPGDTIREPASRAEFDVRLATKRTFGRVPRRSVDRFTERHHRARCTPAPNGRNSTVPGALIRAAAALWPVRAPSSEPAGPRG